MSDPNQKGAKDLLDMIESHYKPNHDYVKVSPDQFPHLDLKFYERAAHQLQNHGFKHLSDEEDRTMTQASSKFSSKAMLRMMVSHDGTITAGIYHVKPRLWLRILLFVLGKSMGRTVDLETEFTDGSFVATSNATAAAAMDVHPMIVREFLPKRASVDAIYERHKELVQQHVKTYPGIASRRFSTIEDIRASQNRMNALKAAYRGEIGGISREELDRLAFSRSQAVDLHVAVSEEWRNRGGK